MSSPQLPQTSKNILLLSSNLDMNKIILEQIAALGLKLVGIWTDPENGSKLGFVQPPSLILVDEGLYPEIKISVEKLQDEFAALLIVVNSDENESGSCTVIGERKYKASLALLSQVVQLVMPQVDLIRRLERKGVMERGRQEQNQRLEDINQPIRDQFPTHDPVLTGMIVVNNHGKIEWVNSNFLHLTGLAHKDAVGKTFGSLYRNLENMPKFDLMWQTVFSGKSWQDRMVYFPDEGSQLVHHLQVSPLTNETGEIIHFLVVIQDTGNPIERIEKQLEIDAYSRQIVDHLPILVASFQGSKLVFINGFGAKLLGWSTPDEILGHSWDEFVSKELIEQFPVEFWEAETGDEISSFNMELPITRQDGSQIFLGITFLLLPSAGGNTIQIIGQDITERKRTQESLRQQAALSEVELSINQSIKLGRVLGQINEFAVQALKVQVGSFILIPDSEYKIFTRHISEIQTIHVDLPLEFNSDDHVLIQWIVQNKKPLIIPDISHSPYEKSEILQSLDAQSGIGMPLLVNDDLVGILFIVDGRPRNFSSVDIKYITALANRGALAIAKVNLYQSLQVAKDIAEKAAQDRADYLASMSHELRAPLAAINNLSELMSSTSLSPVQSDYLALIKSSTGRLLALMNDILDYSRLEASKLGLIEKQFNIIHLVENALDLAAIPAAQKGLDLAYRIDEDVPETLIGDSNRLSQVLTNLLTNAIKFTESGYILIEIRQRADKLALISMVDSEVELQFTVQDTGKGISPEEQTSLFKPFSQVNLPQRMHEPGSGLGLAICKQLVQLMNGEIWVTSSGVPGKGSAFTFTIRTKLVHTPTAPYLQPEQPNLHNKKVALIGQPITSWAHLASRLEFWGMEVHRFEEPDAAVNWFENSPLVDLVILDVNSVNPIDDERLSNSVLHLKEIRPLPVISYAHPNSLVRENLKRMTTNLLRRPISLPRLYRCLVDAVQFANTVTRPRVLEPDLKILVVDDDLINIAAIQLQLERLGFLADSVSNGVEAMQSLAQKEYDLVIMDMRMDAMDGHATTRAIRQTIPANKQPLIAILTAGVTANQLNALQSAGIDAYLEKPISIDRLLHLLEQARRNEPETLNAARLNIDFSHTPPAETAQSGVNEKILQDLVNLSNSSNGNQSKLEIFELFFQSAPTLMDQSRDAVCSGKLASLRDRLHALRGTCELFGAVRFSQLCKSLEQDIADGTLGDVQDRFSIIEAEFNVVLDHLGVYRSKNVG